ncbi:MAG: hypothetical protein K9G11_01515 [Rickettsiaceae bacterium]|nr:hypothetical protein [Rickettsiaceae bacterium]
MSKERNDASALPLEDVASSIIESLECLSVIDLRHQALKRLHIPTLHINLSSISLHSTSYLTFPCLRAQPLVEYV